MPYNIAIKYLQDKYGTRRVKTRAFEQRLAKARNKMDYARILHEASDSDYTVELLNSDMDKVGDINDKELYLLCKQYYLGSEPKKELAEKIKELNLV